MQREQEEQVGGEAVFAVLSQQHPERRGLGPKLRNYSKLCMEGGEGCRHLLCPPSAWVLGYGSFNLGRLISQGLGPPSCPVSEPSCLLCNLGRVARVLQGMSTPTR